MAGGALVSVVCFRRVRRPVLGAGRWCAAVRAVVLAACAMLAARWLSRTFPDFAPGGTRKKSTLARNGRPLSPIDLGGGLWYDMRPFGAVVVPALNGGINYVNRTKSGAR